MVKVIYIAENDNLSGRMFFSNRIYISNNLIYYNIYLENNFLQKNWIATVYEKDYDKIFISLAEYRENRLKEVLNG